MNWSTLLIVVAALAVFFLIRRMSMISPDAAKEAVRKGALVIDVRSPEEYASRHLEGTLNIPLGELSARIGTACPDKNRVILLHCLSGGRSGMGVGTLKSLGYSNVQNLGSYGRAEGILTGALGK
jgi:phage shock protein E